MSADCQSATQQITNLRYDAAKRARDSKKLTVLSG